MHYLEEGDAAACRDCCLELLQDEPENGEALQLLGGALSHLRQYDDAADAFRHVVRISPDSAQAHHNLGHVLRQQERIGEAQECFRQAIILDPAYALAHESLGLAHLAAGEAADAEQEFKRALELESNNPQLLTHLGIACRQQQKPEPAEAAFRKAIGLYRDDVVAHTYLARTLQDQGKLEQASRSYHDALRLRPGDGNLHGELAGVLLALRKPAEALSAADTCLDLIPGHGRALTGRVMALYQLGRDDDANALVDFDRFISVATIETPSGFDALKDFNAALSRHVSEHPTLSFEPEGHATRHGWHTGDLLAGEKGPIAHLQAAINKEVEKYLREHPRDPGHAFLENPPQRWSLVMWAVIMDTQGHQLPHVHTTAWLSGVYYANLPPVIGSGDDDQAGWIEFGRPDENIRGDVEPPIRSCHPHEGMIVLFPSYFFHRTESFESDQQRISIAFDIVRSD